MPIQNLKENLQKARKEKKLNQDKVAEHLNVKRQTYSAYETGKSVPDAITLSKLASLFEVSADYLVGDTNDPTPPNKKEMPPQEARTFEWFKQLFIERGSLKKGEDITKENLNFVLENMDSLVEKLKDKRE